MAAIARLEKQQVNQASVLRRKAEEAAAANNRLKELLQRQKLVNDTKARKQEQADVSNIGTRVRVCESSSSLCFCSTGCFTKKLAP